jgi:hypothetical protein
MNYTQTTLSKITCRKLIFSLILSMFTAGFVNAKPPKAPIVVKYGLHIKRVTVDFQNDKFHADFYWWALFHNDSAKSGYSNTDILNFEYVNGVYDEIGIIQREIQLAKDLGNNYFYYTGLHKGDFYFTPDFRRYPFDKQKLEIIIENSLIPAEELVFEPDTQSYKNSGHEPHLWGLANDVLNDNSKTIYRIFKTEINTGNSIYNSNFGDISLPYQSNYSRITTSLYIDRAFLPYISKIYIPLIIILFLVYMIFFLPTHKIEMSASLTVSAIFCATAFQLAISRSIPEIGYIIYVDKIFHTCYALIAMAFTQSLVTFYLDSSGDEAKKRKAKRLDILFRFLYPILFIVAVVLFAL